MKTKAADCVNKRIESVRDLLEQVYLDGYNAGYQDGQGVKKEPLTDDEWVDLGLPSGTLWSKNYLKDDENQVMYLTYDEASKYSLPTKEQLDELRNFCVIKTNGFNVLFQGINGSILVIPYKGYKAFGSMQEYNDHGYFWIETSDPSKLYVDCGATSKINYSQPRVSMFKGNGLPIMLVRKK